MIFFTYIVSVGSGDGETGTNGVVGFIVLETSLSIKNKINQISKVTVNNLILNSY